MTRYRTIVADPPWEMPSTGKRTSRSVSHEGVYVSKSGKIENADWWNRFDGKRVEIPYQTMTVDEIAKLPVKSLAEDNAHLYLWTVNRYLEDAYHVAREWGFSPSTLLQWCKPPMGIGFGGTFCNTTEFILFCRRGSLKAKQRIDTTWFNWSRPYVNGHIAHSAKPEAFQDVVESVSPAPYLEMFARRYRLGWDVFGNEVDSHVNL
jgi:N6-adenosine-specific RNA methylase IME4